MNKIRHYFTDEKRRTHVITMRMNDKEYKTLREYMEYRGETSASDFIRRATLSWIGVMRRQDEAMERRDAKREQREYKSEYISAEANTNANTDGEKERSKEKESIINVSISSASSKAPPGVESEDPEVWLTDDPERLRTLCISNDLPPENARETLAPYIRSFLGWLREIGTDFRSKGRADTIRHFAAWLPKYLKINNKEYGKNQQHINTNVRRVERLDEIGRACAAGLAAARSGHGLL